MPSFSINGNFYYNYNMSLFFLINGNPAKYTIYIFKYLDQRNLSISGSIIYQVTFFWLLQ
jgi:hypothetical protein